MTHALRCLFLLTCLAWVPAVQAQLTTYPAADPDATTLTIYSSTDTALFEPVLRDFQRVHPGITVRYELMDGAPLHRRYLQETAARKPVADLLLSTSMDLQVKLVNDGYAATHVSENARTLPPWARWRNQAFGFTFEPAVMVLNRNAFAGRPMPQSRGELIEMVRRDRARWRGRIGTYDIAHSSVGYLLASQDARQSGEYGSLVETFGDAGMRIQGRTADLLDLLEKGEIAVGYNMLGSYAQARIDAGAPLVIVYPRDYTLAIARTAVLPVNAPNPAAAHLFLEYLLSLRGQEVLATQSRLPAVRHEVANRHSRVGIVEAQVGPLRPIALGPGLLVYLDAQKRRRLLANWYVMVGHPPP